MESGSLPYWMAFAHARSFTNVRKMEFLIEAVFNAGTDLRTVMDSARSNAGTTFSFNEKEKSGWLDALQEIPNYSFLAEELANTNIRVISVMEPDYPAQLKRKLGKNAPILLYCKGNPDLLHKKSIAIASSKKGGQDALDSALANQGQSIIVLQQGILTYRSNTYYQHIIKGDVLVISPYHPKAPWEAGAALERNKIIDGLATDINVAEDRKPEVPKTGLLF